MLTLGHTGRPGPLVRSKARSQVPSRLEKGHRERQTRAPAGHQDQAGSTRARTWSPAHSRSTPGRNSGPNLPGAHHTPAGRSRAVHWRQTGISRKGGGRGQPGVQWAPHRQPPPGSQVSLGLQTPPPTWYLVSIFPLLRKTAGPGAGRAPDSPQGPCRPCPSTEPLSPRKGRLTDVPIRATQRYSTALGRKHKLNAN